LVLKVSELFFFSIEVVWLKMDETDLSHTRK